MADDDGDVDDDALKIVLLAAVAMIMVVMMMMLTVCDGDDDDDDDDDDAGHVRTSDRKGAFPNDLLAMRGKTGRCGNSPSTRLLVCCRQFAFVVASGSPARPHTHPNTVRQQRMAKLIVSVRWFMV